MRLFSIFIITLLMATAPLMAGAQSYLSKGVNVKAKDKKLEYVLDVIAKQGSFYFSYNSNIVPADSIVSVHIWNKTVKQALDEIFKGRFAYKAVGKHVVIQYPSNSQYWYVSGYVVDAQTGENVRDVSVFESNQLVASLTNDQGYFRLKLKDKIPSTSINVSKSLYNDTLVNIKPGIDQEVKVKIKPKAVEMDEVTISSKENSVEGTWFGKIFLSSKQKMQSINLNKFFVDMSFQGSVIPGVSSQGKMVSQTSNVISVNMIGGYTAGVKGFEMGTIFNINKGNVKYAQAAGILNIVGGDVKGVQLGGIHNTVMGSFTGVQASGISNTVRKEFKGIQYGGIYNLSTESLIGGQFAGIANSAIDTLTGVQYAGIVNMSVKQVTGVQMAGILNTSISEVEGVQGAGVLNSAIKDVKGVQMAGIMNFSLNDINGVQVSGIANYVDSISGVQIGLFNFARKMNGASIGLFSFVWNGYHKVSIFSNEMMPYNVSVKTGTRWFYNIYSFGASPQRNNQAYRVGLGFGSDLPVTKHFSFCPELTGNAIYLGSWAETNSTVKLEANLNYRINKYIALYAGPSLTAYWDNKQPKVVGFATEILRDSYQTTTHNYNLSSWIGWTAGVTVF